MKALKRGNRARSAIILLFLHLLGFLLFYLLIPVKDPQLDVTVLPSVPAQPAALEAWLATREAHFPDITPGAEKQIVWAKPEQPAPTPTALVYLHGFSATRQEVYPLCEELAADLEANLFLTRLRGHGRGEEAMVEGSVAGWMEDGLEALAIAQAIGERVVVVATSNGATLATLLAARGAPLDALVLMSPNYQPKNPAARLLTFPGRGFLVRQAVGEYRSWEPISEAQGRYWTHRYPSQALFPMADLVALTARADLSTIQAPVLAMYSPHDEVIRSELVAERIADFGSAVKRLVEVDYTESYTAHVLAGEILSPGSTERVKGEILRFVQEFDG